jgi:hypothetical protein
LYHPTHDVHPNTESFQIAFLNQFVWPLDFFEKMNRSLRKASIGEMLFSYIGQYLEFEKQPINIASASVVDLYFSDLLPNTDSMLRLSFVCCLWRLNHGNE